MNLILASPTYGPVQPQAVRAIRMAVMHAAAHGVTWVGESSPDKMTVINARNSAVNLALGVPGGCDGIMWIDYDMVPPTDGITRLLAHDKDFVSGLYRNRSEPRGLIAAYWNDHKQDFDPVESDIPRWRATSGLKPIDAAGFGFMSTRIQLISGMTYNYDGPPLQCFGRFNSVGDSTYAGEDLYFCRQVMFHGIQLYVDADLHIGHLGENEVIMP